MAERDGLEALIETLAAGQRVMVAVVDEDFYPFDHDGITGVCVSGEGNYWEPRGLDPAAAFMAECRSVEAENADA